MPALLEELNRPDPGVALAVRDLSKTFAGGRVLDDVSLELEAGRVHALVGGNGSGKSTLIKCLAGVQPGDPGGAVITGGRHVAADRISPGWARANGLRFVHQNPGMFATMSIQENFALGPGYPQAAGMIRWRRLRSRTEALLERFHVGAKPEQILGSLRPAEQAMIAIARAMQDQEASGDGAAVSTLVLDEPTASLPEDEVGILLDAIRRYVAEGLAIVFVSHRLDEVCAVADTVTVLRDGRLVTSRPITGLCESDLIELIVGAPMEQILHQRRHAHAGDVVAALDDVYASGLHGVSLDVHAGEVLGLAGLLGSGRSEVLRVLFGDLRADAGEVRVGECVGQPAGPSAAMAAGVAYVPEDRSSATFSAMTVRENFTAASVARYARHLVVNRRREEAETHSVLDAYGVKRAGLEIPVSLLSGGNQQKVVLARWLHRDPKLVLLDEPTQGVDVGARADIYAILREAAALGVAIILVSSDFEELADLSDRVLVLTAGRVTAELRGSGISRHSITEHVLMGKAGAR